MPKLRTLLEDTGERLVDDDIGDGIEPLDVGCSATEEDDFWIDFQHRLPLFAYEAYMRAASALLTVLAIVVSAHLAVLALGPPQVSLKHLWPEAAWSASALAAWWVLRPSRYVARLNVVDSLKRAVDRMVASKRRWTFWSAVLLLAGIALAVVVHSTVVGGG